MSNERISLAKEWVRTDGWRGYEKPIDAFVSATDTGNWSDSPCPSREVTKELNELKKFLRKHKIPFRETYGKTSNVFSIIRYLVTTPSKKKQARELSKKYIKDNGLYYVDII